MMNTATKNIGHKRWEFKNAGKVFIIDGSNHEFDSREWQLFIQVQGAWGVEDEWIETFETKRDAVNFAEIFEGCG
tara:strand:+ start:1328 stop:1552 length:225 start_codon:yes stop_codon:yes gene_type:complete